ncbi:MAG: hypothetical protein WCL28_05400 [bacterium]
MKTSLYTVFVISAFALMQGCATSNVSYKKTKTAAAKADSRSSRTLAPSLAETYDLSGNEDDSDEYIKRRGNKARGTHDF